MKVKYIGCTDDQIGFGGNKDPRPLLTKGEVYPLFRKEVHSYHTKYFLAPYPTLGFNSVCFEEVA